MRVLFVNVWSFFYLGKDNVDGPLEAIQRIGSIRLAELSYRGKKWGSWGGGGGDNT